MPMVSVRRQDLRVLLFFMIIALGLCLLGETGRPAAASAALRKPPFELPAQWQWAVTAAAGIMAALAAYLVWQTDDLDAAPALRFWLTGQAAAALWPWIFWRLAWLAGGFFLLLLQLAVQSLALAGFKYLRRKAYQLFLPSVIWTLYLGYLNAGYYLLNG